VAKLLVVDDELVLLSALSRILTDVGHQVTTLSSGAQAIALLSGPGSETPDLIITDVLMPGIDGLQMFSIIRQNPSLQHVPFIFISASVSPEIEKLIAGSNRALFLRKPFEVDKLFSAIDQAIGSPDQRQA
jgi:CheY-like chemotaxis protein